MSHAVITFHRHNFPAILSIIFSVLAAGAATVTNAIIGNKLVHHGHLQLARQSHHVVNYFIARCHSICINILVIYMM